MNNVAPESVTVKLLTVELDECSVLGESVVTRIAVVARIDGNGRGVEDIPQNTLALDGPVLDDMIIELVYARLRLLHLLQLVLSRLPRGSFFGVLAISCHPQLITPSLVVVNPDGVVIDLVQDGLKSGLVRLATKVDDMDTGRASILRW